MYALKELEYRNKAPNSATHYQVLDGGITPVAILTNKYSDIRGPKSYWRLILLKNNSIHDIFERTRMTAQEALDIIDKTMQGDSLKGVGSNPDCMLRFVTAFGMHLYCRLDTHSMWHDYSLDKKDTVTFPLSEAKKQIKCDGLPANIPLEGDHIVEVQVLIRKTGEVIQSRQVKIKTKVEDIHFNVSPMLWPTQKKGKAKKSA